MIQAIRRALLLSGFCAASLLGANSDIREALLAHPVTADLGGSTTVNNAGVQENNGPGLRLPIRLISRAMGADI